MAQRRSTKSNPGRLAVRVGSEHLAHEANQLLTLDAGALRQQWAVLFGAEPSPLIGDALLIRALAYRLQEKKLCGLKPAAQRILDRILDSPAGAVSEKVPQPHIGAGTVLIREWGGTHHQVTVLDRDVVYQGRRYNSLSEVARAITGTRWSGPRFFGLRRRAGRVVHG